MTPRTKKIILISILGIAAIGVAIAYYMYNKGPVDVKNATGLKVSSIELYRAFSSDTTAAKLKYTNKDNDKVLEVSGIVVQVSQNQDNKAIVTLKTNESGAFVNCTMEGLATSIKEKDDVTIKGICTGLGMGDADMGIMGDVYLVRCYLAK